MPKQDISIYDKELDWLFRDILGNAPTSLQGGALQQMSETLRHYDHTSIHSFLDVFIPENATKYSNQEIVHGLDFLNSYVNLLHDETVQLESNSLTFYNQAIFQMENLRKIGNRITDKIQALRLYDSVGVRSIFLSGTMPFDWLDTVEANTPIKRMVVSDLANGMVLPIESSRPVAISSIRLGSTSNGTPGDTLSLDRIFRHDVLGSMLDGAPDTYFEYSRTGADIQLELIIELSHEAIVNTLGVSTVEYPFIQNAFIENLYYQLTNGQWVDWTDEPVRLLPEESIYLNPVKTKLIRLLLKSSGSEPIRVGPDRFVQRAILGIRDITVHTTMFASQGQLLSRPKAKPGTSKVSFANLDALHTVDDLFDLSIFVKNKDGNWQVISSKSQTIEDFVDISKELEAKLTCSRKSNSFKNYESTIKVGTHNFNYETFTTQERNPNQITLSHPFDQSSIQLLLDSNIAIDRLISLPSNSGVILDSDTAYRLPALLDQTDISNVDIYVNGQLSTRVDRAPGEKEHTAGMVDGQILIRFGTLDPSSNVSYRLRKEDLHFKQAGMFYTAVTRWPVIPVKSKIQLESLTNVGLSGIQYLAPHQVRHDIEGQYDYIYDFDIFEESATGLVNAGYVLQSGSPERPREFLTDASHYYVDSENSSIHFFEAPVGPLFFVFKYKTIEVVRGFEIAKNTQGATQGIDLFPRIFHSIAVTETLGAAVPRDPTVCFEADSLTFAPSMANTLLAANRIAYLSHSNILPGSMKFDGSTAMLEVPFVNGYKELTNGDYATYELTSGVESSNRTIWTVTLEGLDSSLGIFPLDPAVFANQKPYNVDPTVNLTVSGDWSFSYSGSTLILQAYGIGLPTTMSIGFFFLEINTSQPRYSVDYVNGQVFFSDTIDAEGLHATYEVAPYRVSYLIGEPVTDFSIDRDANISVPLHAMEPNRLLYVVFDEFILTQDIKDLENYYSPVFRSLTFEAAS